MKIEKVKLYYNPLLNTVIKAVTDRGNDKSIHCNKIAVHCPTKEDWDYVNKAMGWEWDFSKSYSIRLLNDENRRINNIQGAKQENYHVITIDKFKEFYPPNEEQDPYVWGSIDISSKKDEVFNPKPYYDNSKGSLYKVASERGWNAYLFDLVKRLERGGKKDPLRQEIEKSIDVLKIWLNEL